MTQRYPHSPYRIPESALTNPALLQAVQEIQDSPVSLVNKARITPKPKSPRIVSARSVYESLTLNQQRSGVLVRAILPGLKGVPAKPLQALTELLDVVALGPPD